MVQTRSGRGVSLTKQHPAGGTPTGDEQNEEAAQRDGDLKLDPASPSPRRTKKKEYSPTPNKKQTSKGADNDTGSKEVELPIQQENSSRNPAQMGTELEQIRIAVNHDDESFEENSGDEKDDEGDQESIVFSKAAGKGADRKEVEETDLSTKATGVASSNEENDMDKGKQPDSNNAIIEKEQASNNNSPTAIHLLSIQRHHKARPTLSNPDKNELTQLIPGYTAPLKLDTSSLLSKYQPKGGIAELTRRAQETDKSTAAFCVKPDTSTTTKQVNQSSLYASRFKSGSRTKPVKPPTPGDGWFGFVPTEMTNEVKQDLALIRNRTYLDPKRFYKKADVTKTGFVQVGTVVEGAAEFYSSRLTKKQQKATLTQEIMADPDASGYASRKYKRLQQEKSEQSRKRAKHHNRKHFKGRKGY